MNRQRFQHLESGQGVTEYALLAVIAGIAAIGIITLLGGTNFREGIIYEGIYRPVQCAVQGITRTTARRRGSRRCASPASTIIAPTAASCATSTTTRAITCGPIAPTAATKRRRLDPAAEMIINRMQLIRESGGGYPFNTSGTSGTEVTEGNYEIVVSRGNNVDDLGYRGPVESVRFQISPSVDKAEDGTSVSNVTDDVDSNVNSLEGADSDDYTVNNYEFVELVAGTSYTITATPFSENGAGGDPGTSFQVTIDVVPSNVTPPAIQSVRFIPSISTRDTVNLQCGHQRQRTAGRRLHRAVPGVGLGGERNVPAKRAVGYFDNHARQRAVLPVRHHRRQHQHGRHAGRGQLHADGHAAHAGRRYGRGRRRLSRLALTCWKTRRRRLLLSGFNLINADTDEVEQALSRRTPS